MITRIKEFVNVNNNYYHKTCTTIQIILNQLQFARKDIELCGEFENFQFQLLKMKISNALF